MSVIRKIISYTFSFSAGNFFKNGITDLAFLFFAGSPITVFSAPLGHPHFFSFGERIMSCMPITHVIRNIYVF